MYEMDVRMGGGTPCRAAECVVADPSAAVRQGNLLSSIPCRGKFMIGKDRLDLQHGSEPSMRNPDSVSSLTRHIGNRVAHAEPRGKFISPTKTTNCGKRIFQIWLAPNGSINEWRNRELPTCFTADRRNDQRRIRVEIEGYHRWVIIPRQFGQPKSATLNRSNRGQRRANGPWSNRTARPRLAASWRTWWETGVEGRLPLELELAPFGLHEPGFLPLGR